MNTTTEPRSTPGTSRWLKLMAFVLITSPLRMLYDLAPAYLDFFRGQTLQTLLSSGSDLHDPFVAFLAIAEMAVNALLFSTWLVAGALFFRKHKRFPVVYTTLVAVMLVFGLLDPIAIHWIDPGEPLPVGDIATDSAKTLFVIALTVPYLLKSTLRTSWFVNG